MKKLTKKAIKEAANYMIQIDWKANYRNALEAEVLEAKTLVEAMNEASKRFDENVYMLSILEKTGAITGDGGPGLVYEEILRSRTAGRWMTVQEDGLIHGTIWGRYIWDEFPETTTILDISRSR